MNINKQLQEIQELKERLKVLENEVLNSVQPKQEYKRWRAERKEDYWYVDCIGDIIDDYENHEKRDNFRYSTGNYFKTQQEAQEYKENLITKQKLKDLALRLNKGVEIDWDNTNQLKYYIYLYNSIALMLGSTYSPHIGQVYCLDSDFLKIANEEIGGEALIKLIKSGV